MTKNKKPNNKQHLAPKPKQELKKPPKKLIEKNLHEQEEMMEEELVDNYTLYTPGNKELSNALQAVSYIQMPKFMLSCSNKIQHSNKGEKTNLVLKLFGVLNKKDSLNPYYSIIKAAKNGIQSDLFLEVFDSDETKSVYPILKVVFEKPRIHAIDFGNFSMKREEEREMIVEIDYESIIVNDEEF